MPKHYGFRFRHPAYKAVAHEPTLNPQVTQRLGRPQCSFEVLL